MSVGRAGKAVDDPAAYVKGWGPRETAGAAGEEDRMSGTSGHTPASDDVKRKFREALDRKNAHAGRDVARSVDFRIQYRFNPRAHAGRDCPRGAFWP